MKLITVHYLGFTAMDRRFSNPMLPWIVSEIRKRDYYERVRSFFIIIKVISLCKEIGQLYKATFYLFTIFVIALKLRLIRNFLGDT